MRLDDLAADPEAEPESAELLARDGALEPFEHALLILRLDPDPVVADLEEHVRFPALQPHFDRLAGAVLGRVADQVVDQLIEASAVPVAAHRAVDLQPHGTARGL